MLNNFTLSNTLALFCVTWDLQAFQKSVRVGVHAMFFPMGGLKILIKDAQATWPLGCQNGLGPVSFILMYSIC